MDNCCLQSTPSQPMLNLEIKLTADEIYTCLQKTSRRSKKIVWFETIILILVVLDRFLGFILYAKKDISSVFITIAALIVLAIVWLVPPLHNRYLAEQDTKSDDTVLRMKVYEDHLAFGEGESTTVKFDECKTIICENIIILSIGTQVVGIPHRLSGENGWKLLLNKFKPVKE